MSATVGETGAEHVVLSDGWQRIRLDIEGGSLLAGHPVILHYGLFGFDDAEPKLLPLRRLMALIRHRRFLRTLTRPDPWITRHLLALRVHDALRAGASQSDIAEELFGNAAEAGARTDSLRSRVRRLVREARRLCDGGWRMLMHRRR